MLCYESSAAVARFFLRSSLLLASFRPFHPSSLSPSLHPSPHPSLAPFLPPSITRCLPSLPPSLSSPSLLPCPPWHLVPGKYSARRGFSSCHLVKLRSFCAIENMSKSKNIQRFTSYSDACHRGTQVRVPGSNKLLVLLLLLLSH